MEQILNQNQIGRMACGPCSIIHSLGKDPEEVKSLILKCIETPSVKYQGKKMMYSGKDGITAEDILAIVKSRYQIQLQAQFLNRNEDPSSKKNKIKGETGIEFVRRIHAGLQQALKSECLPILELRSFVCEPQKWDFKWFCTLGHFHTLVQVQEELPANALGFTYQFKESLTGELMQGYLYFNPYGEGYSATRDFSVDLNGNEVWEWLDDFPYLEVIAPIHLETDKCPYQARIVTVLKLLISHLD